MGIFKPTWQSKNADKRLKAVQVLADEAVLTQIASNKDELMNIRLAATENIKNEDLLLGLVLENQLAHKVQLAALKSIRDPKRLAVIAREDQYQQYFHSEYETRVAAVKKIFDEDVLFNLAIGDNCEWRVYAAAIERIRSKDKLSELFEYLIVNDTKRADFVVKNPDFRPSREYIESLAMSNSSAVRSVITRKVNDVKLLKKMMAIPKNPNDLDYDYALTLAKVQYEELTGEELIYKHKVSIQTCPKCGSTEYSNTGRILDPNTMEERDGYRCNHCGQVFF